VHPVVVMRNLLYTLLFIIAGSRVWANEIDHLQTAKDVKAFLIAKVDRKFQEYNLFEGVAEAGPSGSSPHFYKLDLDGNGLTDLVVDDTYFFVVTDRGRGKYEVQMLRSLDAEVSRKLLSIDSFSRPRRLMILSTRNFFRKGSIIIDSLVKMDTLVYTTAGFMEYNDQPAANFQLEKISVRTAGCFGTCPIFEMDVDKKGWAHYLAIEFNEENGEYWKKIPDEEMQKLIQVLRYLPLDKLDSSYTIDVTDLPSIDLEVRYNGKIKKISDYDEDGSIGLKLLYSLFFRWKDTMTWK
jgi:hypothetical protein